MISSNACDRSGHTLGASATVLALTKKLAVSPSSTVHGGQHDTKNATFELLMHAAFVADEIWGFMLEPAGIVLKSDWNPTERTPHLIVSPSPFCPSHPPTPPQSRSPALITLPPLAKLQLVWRRLCEALLSSSSPA